MPYVCFGCNTTDPDSLFTWAKPSAEPGPRFAIRPPQHAQSAQALRSVSDGRSKRLRDHLLSEEKFVAKLSAVEAETREEMERRVAKWEARRLHASQDASPSKDSKQEDRGTPEDEAEDDRDCYEEEDEENC